MLLQGVVLSIKFNFVSMLMVYLSGNLPRVSGRFLRVIVQSLRDSGRVGRVSRESQWLTGNVLAVLGDPLACADNPSRLLATLKYYLLPTKLLNVFPLRRRDFLGKRRDYLGRRRDCFGRHRDCFGRHRDCFGRRWDCLGRRRDYPGRRKDYLARIT